jgi:hypothetical protein
LFQYLFCGFTFLFWYAEIQHRVRLFPQERCVMVGMLGHELHEPHDAQHGKKEENPT